LSDHHDRLLVVLPTYCERPNIERVLDRVLAADAGIDVLVVDDDSPDGTGKIADEIAEREPRVRVLHRPAKGGLGTAYRAGFQVGLAEGYGYLAEIDATCPTTRATYHACGRQPAGGPWPSARAISPGAAFAIGPGTGC